MGVVGVDGWFLQEVLPLEAALVRYLRRNWRDESEIADLRQEVYVRVYDKALSAIPAQTKPFVFMTARNLIIDRVRRLRVVCIEAVADIEELDVTADELTPDRVASAREELRCLQAALDRLPPRCREVVALRKIEGLSQRDVAARLGIKEDTVEHHVAKGMRALADALSERSGGAEAMQAPPEPARVEER
jgi:RNA polymerase sigma factor (sigma-70 family)